MRVDAKAAKSRDLPLPDLGGAFPLIAWENDVATVEKEEGMELRELRRLMYRWGNGAPAISGGWIAHDQRP